MLPIRIRRCASKPRLVAITPGNVDMVVLAAEWHEPRALFQRLHSICPNTEETVPAGLRFALYISCPQFTAHEKIQIFYMTLSVALLHDTSPSTRLHPSLRRVIKRCLHRTNRQFEIAWERYQHTLPEHIESIQGAARHHIPLGPSPPSSPRKKPRVPSLTSDAVHTSMRQLTSIVTC